MQRLPLKHWIGMGLVLLAFAACAKTTFLPTEGEGVPPSEGGFTLPMVQGDFVEWVKNFPVAKAGSEAYKVPSSEVLNSFREAWEKLLQGQIQEAREGFSSWGYDLVWFEDFQYGGFYLLYPKEEAAGHGWAIFAYQPAFKKNLILEASHPVADQFTETLAADFFLQLKARGFLMAGAHRCANAEVSSCSGTTSVCSEDASLQSYRISDAAHFTGSYFQAVHEILLGEDPSLIAVALHGFAQQAGEPHAYVSDGTNFTGGSQNLANRFVTLFKEQTLDAVAVQSCNDGSPGAQLCGTTDVQGRWANESLESCTVSSDHSTGRFLHLEQSLELRTPEGAAGPQQVLATLGALN